MPKSPLRTSKKKKYNARFPPARIKKIMQTDEDVGKVAAAVPVIISRALEMFIESLITETAKTTIARNAKTLSSSHIKQTIETNKQFDFLRDLVANVPDHQVEDNSADVSVNDAEPTSKKGRGRPKKVKDGCSSKKPKGESSKASSDTSEEEDEDEEDEDTETDEESSVGYSVTPPYIRNSDRLGQSAEPSNSTEYSHSFQFSVASTSISNKNFHTFNSVMAKVRDLQEFISLGRSIGVPESDILSFAQNERKSELELLEADRAERQAEREAQKSEGEAQKSEGEAQKAQGETQKAQGETQKAEGEAQKAEGEGVRVSTDCIRKGRQRFRNS
ncbi:dr1-associated corepressor [Biomphalaria pfeifferi]|uniref:Dr1-associated corepressor n=1 Tax=Biomphalaria pfeifferi TaxID=112525 RepID=A0AAD8FB35_BIOPF|nr:dr1-associated corepressor [Biomphalaria pfeifferi]